MDMGLLQFRAHSRTRQGQLQGRSAIDSDLKHGHERVNYLGHFKHFRSGLFPLAVLQQNSYDRVLFLVEFAFYNVVISIFTQTELVS